VVLPPQVELCAQKGFWLPIQPIISYSIFFITVLLLSRIEKILFLPQTSEVKQCLIRVRQVTSIRFSFDLLIQSLVLGFFDAGTQNLVLEQLLLVCYLNRTTYIFHISRSRAPSLYHHTTIFFIYFIRVSKYTCTQTLLWNFLITCTRPVTKFLFPPQKSLPTTTYHNTKARKREFFWFPLFYFSTSLKHHHSTTLTNSSFLFKHRNTRQPHISHRAHLKYH
jgi:hypothetical protein